jgi:hypothetical protein
MILSFEHWVGSNMILKRRTFMLAIAGLITFAVLVSYRLAHGVSFPIQLDISVMRLKDGFDGTWNYTRDADDLLLDSQQCEEAFPGLFEEGGSQRLMQDRLSSHITFMELDALPQQNGYIQAMIYDQQVWI